MVKSKSKTKNHTVNTRSVTRSLRREWKETCTLTKANPLHPHMKIPSSMQDWFHNLVCAAALVNVSAAVINTRIKATDRGKFIGAPGSRGLRSLTAGTAYTVAEAGSSHFNSKQETERMKWGKKWHIAFNLKAHLQ